MALQLPDVPWLAHHEPPGLHVKHIISHYLREMGLMKPEPEPEPEPKFVSVDVEDPAFQAGWKNGYAWGEVVGRKQAFEDLLEQLRLHGKAVDQLDESEIREAQVKSTH